MRILSRLLLVFFVLTLSIGLSAQNDPYNGYTPDWQIGQHGEQNKENNSGATTANKPDKHEFVVDWAIGQQGDPEDKAESRPEYISDWHVFNKDENSPILETPKDIVEADNLYFETSYQVDQALPVKELPIVSASYENRRNNLSLFGLLGEVDIREFYYRDSKDEQGRLKAQYKYDLHTNSLAARFLYEYAENGDVVVKVQEYHQDGSINREYTYKNHKLEGEYVMYDQKGTMLISRNYKDGALNGYYFMYYPKTGNTHKRILYKNDKKVHSEDYAPDGITLIKETNYNDKGGVLTTKEPIVTENGEKAIQYYDYGYKPYSKIVTPGERDLSNTPMTMNGKSFMLEGALIEEIETLTGKKIPADFNGSRLHQAIDNALAYIVEHIGENMELSSKDIDLIFYDNMIFAMTHLARKYELAGNRTAAQEVRYEVMLLGTLMSYNSEVYNNISREEYQMMRSIYDQLNITYGSYSVTDMTKSLEERSIMKTSNINLRNVIVSYNQKMLMDIKPVEIK